jgi:ribosome biogenesis protein ERB1
LDPEDRPFNFLPKMHSALRQVAQYPRFIQERFERCLDLYLAPRAIKQKLDIDPESLIPKLPSPKDLRPFPTKLSITYKGHKGRVRSVKVDPTGQWLASVGDDNCLKIWEVESGRCFNTVQVNEPIVSVAWNPNKTLSLVAISYGSKVSLIAPDIANDDIVEMTKEVITDAIQKIAKNAAGVVWETPNAEEKSHGHLLQLRFVKVDDHHLYVECHKCCLAP